MKISRFLLRLALVLLPAYGITSTLYVARDTQDTYDESAYRRAGQIYLEQRTFDFNHDHPPLAKWISAVYPEISKQPFRIEPYRYSHVILYGIAGIFVGLMLFGYGMDWAALLFEGYYFLSPNLKAMASLHVLDADVSIYFLLSLIFSWLYVERNRVHSLWKAWLFGATAALTKISGLFAFIPITFVTKGRRNWWRGIAVFLGVLFLAYLGALGQLGWFAASLGFQFRHNLTGQGVVLLGHYYPTGVWYYYLVLLFLKLPIPFLLLLIGTVPYSRGGVLKIFLLPAGLYFIVISLSRVQLGFRYFLPSLLALFFVSSLNFESKLKQSLWARASVVGLLLASFFVDAQTLRQGSYLSYFNTLAPDPTRNFSESSIDWRQGLPRHLQDPDRGEISLNDFIFYDFFKNAKTATVIAGADAITNHEKRAEAILSLEREAVVAGNELFQMTPPLAYFWASRIDGVSQPLQPARVSVEPLKNLDFLAPETGDRTLVVYPTLDRSVWDETGHLDPLIRGVPPLDDRDREWVKAGTRIKLRSLPALAVIPAS